MNARTRAAAVAVLFGFPTLGAWAVQTPQPTTEELLLNQTTIDRQDDPFVALQPTGFATVWEFDDNDIISSIFDGSGVRTVSEFMVDALVANGELDPGIAAAADGSFVVTFGGPDADQSGIFYRRYNSAGTPQGGSLPANTTTAGDQDDSRVAMRPNGDFAIVWENPDADSDGIILRIFAANGTPLTAEIPVNTTTAGNQQAPAVAVDNAGNAYVVWQSPDSDSQGVFGRVFDATGNPQTGEFQVNTFTDGSQDTPRIACDADGNFVCVWESFLQDGEDDGVYAQRFNSAAAKIGDEFRVNTTTAGEQDNPVVSVGDDGTFVVAWEGPDENLTGVFFQRFELINGIKRGIETQANTFTTDNQDTPDISLGSDGRMVLAWESATQDGDLDAAIGRLYTLEPVNASTRRPIVDINGRDKRTVSKNRLSLRGTAIDNGEVAEVLLKKRGKKFRSNKIRGIDPFRVRLRLKPGRNVFVFRAVDDEGLFSRRARVIITRE